MRVLAFNALAVLYGPVLVLAYNKNWDLYGPELSGALTGVLLATVLDMNEAIRDMHNRMVGWEGKFFWMVVAIIAAFSLFGLIDTWFLASGRGSLTSLLGWQEIGIALASVVGGELTIASLRYRVNKRGQPCLGLTTS